MRRVGFASQAVGSIMPPMTDPVLNEQELAALLRVPGKTVEALLARTDLPRFAVEGKVRFLTARVLAWCERHEGFDLLPAVAPVAVIEPPVKVVRPPSKLPPPKSGEHPWVDSEALDALASGATDSGRNLDRLKLRDALLELNDSLLGALARYSGGRLHPHYDEKSRTSPWRLEAGSRIDVISIAWGAGDHAPAQFADRPHIEVELSKGELRIALDAADRGFAPALDEATLDALRDEGIAVELTLEGLPATFAKVYSLPDPAPSVSTVVAALEADLERLVPLWAQLV